MSEIRLLEIKNKLNELHKKASLFSIKILRCTDLDKKTRQKYEAKHQLIWDNINELSREETTIELDLIMPKPKVIYPLGCKQCINKKDHLTKKEIKKLKEAFDFKDICSICKYKR